MRQKKNHAVLPVRIPNILVNGADGIAVGMATSIPPHNLGEVIDAVKAYMKDNTISVKETDADISKDRIFRPEVLWSIKMICRKIYETGSGKIQLAWKSGSRET